MAQEQRKRPHIYELDPLRACTALGVVAVHAFSYTTYLTSDETGYQMQNSVVVALHFTREVFLFVTAFALVYVYHGRPFAPLQFWKKRALGVLFPYIVWSIIYILVMTPFVSLTTFLQTTIFDIFTGNASYQLYYILLTLQFYLFFPLFLPLIRIFARHPWITLAVSGGFQGVFFFLDYHTIQSSNQPFWQTVSDYQDRFLLVYQFYFVLGGLTAYYFREVRAFLLRHGRVILGLFLFALAVLWAHFLIQVRIYREGVGYASSVMQPMMIFYSVTVIFFILWLTCCWTSRNGRGQRPRGYRFWHMLSDASFGVYLIHALILSALLKWLVPILPASWFEPARVFLTWLLAAGVSMAISVLLTRIPVVSRLVGRSVPLREKRVEEAERPLLTRTASPTEVGESQPYVQSTQHV